MTTRKAMPSKEMLEGASLTLFLIHQALQQGKDYQGKPPTEALFLVADTLHRWAKGEVA